MQPQVSAVYLLKAAITTAPTATVAQQNVNLS
jgi:hypothetical protein